ncbi:MAG TPA: hemolysin III family protein [Pyrinomonadaceae bacterium]|nr:hemolysin III family protein [Pyrinomonadaceae bacterium]
MEYSRRPPSPSEEKANTISHGLGLIASLVAAPVLVITAMKAGGPSAVIGPAVFAASVISLYLASTLYHALPETRGKGFFRLMDHAAIFILIAGSYTPFTLGVMRGPWGWSLFGVVWGLAVMGLILKALPRTRYSRATIVLYVLMGWLAVVATRPILTLIPMPGVLWIVAGGLAYTAGLVFFGMQKLRFNHFIWHLFVMAGTVCHFFAVLWYAG